MGLGLGLGFRVRPGPPPAPGLNMASNMAIEAPEGDASGAWPSLVPGLSDSDGVVRDASAGSAARAERAPGGSGAGSGGEEAPPPLISGSVAVANASSNIARRSRVGESLAIASEAARR